jgi:hypothetical protein
LRRTGRTVESGGNTIAFEYTAKYDGADYPVSGSPDFDAISLKRINERTAEAALFSADEVKFVETRDAMGYDLAAVATVIALGHIFLGHFEGAHFEVAQGIEAVPDVGPDGSCFTLLWASGRCDCIRDRCGSGHIDSRLVAPEAWREWLDS